MNFTAKQIADITGGTIKGDPNKKINSVAKIEEGKNGDLCFLSNEKYKKYIYTTKASVIIVNKSFYSKKKIDSTLIKVDDAYSSFSQLIELYNIKVAKSGISDKANIERCASIGKNTYIGAFTSICKNVTIGKNVQIYPNCYIGENSTIGDNTMVYSNTSIYHSCKIGSRNIIHSGVVIGADGFGFAIDKKKKYKKISQIGNVEISNNVEIGANTIIDRATMGSTKINEGVKLDNLIQIGHNVEIGKNTIIAAQTAIAGSSKIGKNCMIGGQVAIAGHLTIADDVKIAGQSGVASSIKKKGSVLQGPLAFKIREFQRSYIIFKKLPKIYKQLNSILRNE